jgi:hypothetical protein
MIKHRAKTTKTMQINKTAMSLNRFRNASVLYPGRTINFDKFLHTLMTTVEWLNNSVSSLFLQSCSSFVPSAIPQPFSTKDITVKSDCLAP